MDAIAIVATLAARGARLQLVDGDTLRVTPRSALDDRLRDAIRAGKLALIELLRSTPERPAWRAAPHAAIYAAITADTRGAASEAAVQRHVALNGAWVYEELLSLDQRCDLLARCGADAATYRAAVALLVARMDELRRWYANTPAVRSARRLAMERNTPVTAPAQLDDGTTVHDVGRFIGRLMTAVDYVLRHEDEHVSAVLDIYLRQLAQLGVVARVLS